MKKVTYFIFIAIISFTYTCKKESENYSFYRPSHPQNFRTKIGGELYAYTATDSTIARADYYLKVQGKIKTYGSNIAKYGHCWSTSSNPTISDNWKDYDGAALEYGGVDTASFITTLAGLKPNTDYYIRSYVKVPVPDSEGDTIYGYNPVVSKISTLPAINEWYEQFESNKPLNGSRFDAVAANFGDSLFFGTGNSGNAFPNKDMYWYDPATQSWDVFPSTNYAITDGIAFAVEFTDNVSQQGSKTRCLYVGLGDLVGKGLPTDNSNFLMQYDFEDGFWIPKVDYPFIGPPRTGAVAFVLGDKAYVGTGKGYSYLNDWYVYFPANDRDGDSKTIPWRGMGSNVPGGASALGRTGAIAFTMNGRAYFGLGRDANGNFLKDFWEFRPNETDATLGTWTKKADFPGTARANAVAFAIGDQGYVGTGDNSLVNMETDGGIPAADSIFYDFYRYDPFNNKWHKQENYTANQQGRMGAIRPITHAVGMALQGRKLGFIGYGIIPDNYVVPNLPESFSAGSRAQEDFWQYQPYNAVAK